MFHSDLNNLIKGLHTWNISISSAVKYYNWNIYPLVKKVNSKSLKQELCSKSWRFNLKNVNFYCIIALFCYKDWVVSKLGWPTLLYTVLSGNLDLVCCSLTLIIKEVLLTEGILLLIKRLLNGSKLIFYFQRRR